MGFWVTYQQVTSFSREEDGPSAAGAALNRSLKSSPDLPFLSRTFYSGSRSHAWKRTAAAFYLTDNFIRGADNPSYYCSFLFLRNIILPFLSIFIRPRRPWALLGLGKGILPVDQLTNTDYVEFTFCGLRPLRCQILNETSPECTG